MTLSDFLDSFQGRVGYMQGFTFQVGLRFEEVMYQMIPRFVFDFQIDSDLIAMEHLEMSKVKST